MKSSHESTPQTCSTCVEAEQNAATHGFNDACDHCAARHFAHLQVFYESGKTRSITVAYKAALERRFGAKGSAAAHVNVKAWAKRIDAARGV